MMKTNKYSAVISVDSVLLRRQRLGTLLYAFIALACSFVACAASAQGGSPVSPYGRVVTVIPNVALPGVLRTIDVNGNSARGGGGFCNDAELFYTKDSRPAIYITSRPDTSGQCDGVVRFAPTVSGTLPITNRKDSVDYAFGVMIVSSETNRGTNPVITVIPELGWPNEPRRIVVESEFPRGCALLSPVVDAASAKSTGVVVVRVAAAPCGPAPEPNRVEVTYTPTKSGVERIVVVQSDGIETRTLAESKLRTGFKPNFPMTTTLGPPPPTLYPSEKALSDITGTWFDPASNGSGLLFSHNFNGTDAVFGTWYMYDTNGNPRWFTIQDVEWTNGGSEFFGKLYETRAASGGACTVQTCVGNSSRVAVATNVIWTGRVHFVFTDAGAPNMPVLQKARISLYSGNDLVLSSMLTRLNF
jgi:hypothetical protein